MSNSYMNKKVKSLQTDLRDMLVVQLSAFGWDNTELNKLDNMKIGSLPSVATGILPDELYYVDKELRDFESLFDLYTDQHYNDYINFSEWFNHEVRSNKYVKEEV